MISPADTVPVIDAAEAAPAVLMASVVSVPEGMLDAGTPLDTENVLKSGIFGVVISENIIAAEPHRYYEFQDQR